MVIPKQGVKAIRGWSWLIQYKKDGHIKDCMNTKLMRARPEMWNCNRNEASYFDDLQKK